MRHPASKTIGYQLIHVTRLHRARTAKLLEGLNLFPGQEQVLEGVGVEELQILMEVEVVETIKRFVEEGSGVGLMLQSSVEAEIERGLLVEIPPPGESPSVELLLVRRPHREGSPLVEGFVDALRQGLREHSDQNQAEKVPAGR